MKGRRPRSAEYDAAASIYLADESLTVAGLARRLGVKYTNLRHALELRVTIRNPDQNPGPKGIVPVEEFVRMWRTTSTNKLLAKRLGCSVTCVQERAYRLGLYRYARRTKTGKLAEQREHA